MKQYDSAVRDTYQTGKTMPPKNHYGMITALLILITVLVSAVTLLSMLNVQLIQQLKQQTQQLSAFEPAESIAQVDASAKRSGGDGVLGLSFTQMDELYRSYHQLPNGLYISSVKEGSISYQAGICAGDVLISCNGAVVKSEKDLLLALDSGANPVTVTVFRDSSQLDFTLNLP